MVDKTAFKESKGLNSQKSFKITSIERVILVQKSAINCIFFGVGWTRGMVLSKRGIAPLVFVLVTLALVVSTGVYFIATDDASTDSITGAVTGLATAGSGDDGAIEIETITSCNITLSENISNIGHDYECTGANGFFIGQDNLTIDCQNHSITCVGACDGMAGFVLDNDDRTTIQNCRIYNFDDGFRITNNANFNLLTNNILGNNADGIEVYNSTSNNVTLSYFNNNTACGVKVSNLSHGVGETDKYNNIWNNRFFTNGTVGTGAPEACNDLNSYTFWYLEKNCAQSNIIGGPCLGGNEWSTYTGVDITGDGLGDSNIPYQDGDIQAVAVGDQYPLVDPCTIPGVISEDTECPATELVSDTGEGMAITASDTVFECDGTILNANRTGPGGPWTWADDMRGIEIVGVNNVTVRGCEIHDFKYGIYISNAYDITLENNHIHNNNETAIYVTSLSYNISIINNTVDNTFDNGTNQSYGIHFIGSYPATESRVSEIKNSTITNATKAGIFLNSNSDYVSIWDNLIANNSNGTVIEDSSTTDLRRNRFEDNDNTGLYFEGATIIDQFGDYLSSENNFTRNNVGLEARSSTSTDTIVGTFINNTNRGINLIESPIDIAQVNVSGSSRGIHIGSTSDVTLGSLTLFENTADGIRLSGTTNIQIDSGTGVMNIFDNGKGINFQDTNDSLLQYSNYFTEHSLIWNNSDNLFFANSNNNTITGFTITNASSAGINITAGSSNNLFYNNNISDNTMNAEDNESNSWNTSKSSGSNIIGGPNLGGNFWSDYFGADTTGDGIGDDGIPHNSSNGINISGTGDFLPLIGVGNASCNALTHDITLNGNISAGGDCFNIGAHNVELDCAGFSINGPGSGTAIFINDFDNTTIQNCEITNFNRFISSTKANNSIIYNNTFLNLSNVSGDSSRGIIVSSSTNLNISGNVFNATVHYQLFPAVLPYVIEFSAINSSIIENNTFINNNNTLLINTGSLNNTIHSNTLRNNSYGPIFTSSYNNTIYNNYFNNTFGPSDNQNNSWNTSYTCNTTNILGGDCIGGNFWSAYDYFGADTTGDGIGDTQIPFNFLNQINATEDLSVATGDFLPLVSVQVACGTITKTTTLTQNITAAGDCFIITADNIVLDFDGFVITGNGSGIGVNISDHTGVTVLGATINNFTYGVYVDPSSEINVSNLVIANATYGVFFDYTNNSSVEYVNISETTYAILLNNSLNNTILTNNITSNNYGLWLESSTNNNIYDNVFDNTQNAQDDGSFNNWNTSYQGSTANIIGGSATGGNFWSDYNGIDNGLGVYPYNQSADGIGDTQVPYTQNITAGDALPLIANNGSVDVCQEITTDTVLTSNITCVSGDGVTVSGDDITLNCQGYSIIGAGTDAGILVENRDGITIRNCDVSNFYYGIKVTSSTNTNITDGNSITANDFYGIYLYGSNDTIIDSNDVTNDNNGVYSISSNNTQLTNNTINLNKKFYGYYSYNSGNATIYNNTMYNNYHGIYFVGSDEGNISSNDIFITDVYSLFLHSGSDSSIIRDNTIRTGKHGIYSKSNSSSNTIINNSVRDHSSTGLYFNNIDNPSIESNTVANNSQNVLVYSTSGSILSHNVIANASTGLNINNSVLAVLTNNTINASLTPVFNAENATSITLYNNTFYDSAYINGSDSAYLSGNNMTELAEVMDFNFTNSDSITLLSNNLEFVFISDSTTLTIQSNTLLRMQVEKTSSAQIISNTLNNNANVSIQLSDVNSSTLRDNTVKNNTGGISLLNSYSNTIYDNWLQSNGFGMNVSSSQSNTVYNNYFQNTVNVYEDIANTWFMSYSCSTPNIVGGPCKGGNFYSDYYGLDDGSGSRDEGDGIGDNPAYHAVSDFSNDSFPLVLYVARQYYSPNDAETLGLTATANFSGILVDEQVLPNTLQVINYSASNTTYAELTGLLNQSNVDASNLFVHYNQYNQTFVNTSGTTGFASDYTMYIYHNNQFDAGIYLCPEASDINSTNSTCDNRINVSSFPTTTNKGQIVSAESTYYKVENVTNASMGISIESTDICGANITHDVTLSQDTNCSGTAFSLNASEVTIDCAGYRISGDGSGSAFNVTVVNDVTIQHCVISDFAESIVIDAGINIKLYNISVLNASSTGIQSTGSSGSNITNFTSTETSISGISLSGSSGSNFFELDINSSNNGMIFLESSDNNISNSYFRNNTLGLNFLDVQSAGNLVYNNYFNNSINVNESGGLNFYNTTVQNATNIIGGSQIAGNFWHDYSGWDIDLDGIGETETPYDSNSNITLGNGDFFPLTPVGQLTCGEVTTNITMGKNLAKNSTCFNVTASDLTIDCAGYSISRNGGGVMFGINAVNQNNVTVQHCTILNASGGIMLVNNTNSTLFNNTIEDSINFGILLVDSNRINASNNTVSTSGTSIALVNLNDSTIERNIFNGSNYGLAITRSYYNNFSANLIENNSEAGINSTDSGNNTFYNNYINNSLNIEEPNGTNFYNTTYSCSDNFTNIVGGNCSAGNFWSDYLGSDAGNGSGVFNMTPWNISGDYVGDDLIPYNASGNITGSGVGDYHPLLKTSSSSSSSSSSSTSSTSSTSSSSSSSGGGGGGGGSSSTSSSGGDSEDETCSESWTCTSWSDCSDSIQTRTCSDNNGCGTTEDKPDESRSCTEEVETTADTTDTSDADEDTSTTPIIEYITEPSPARTLALSGLALLAAFGTVYAYWGFMHPAARLRRRLRGTHRILGDASTSNLKGQYAGIYKLYMKLSEKNKQNFYANVSKIREHIEEQLKAEKEIEMLFDKSQFGDLQSRKQIYMQIYEEYQKLPASTQGEVYPKMVDLRERLERGVE